MIMWAWGCRTGEAAAPSTVVMRSWGAVGLERVAMAVRKASRVGRGRTLNTVGNAVRACDATSCQKRGWSGEQDDGRAFQRGRVSSSIHPSQRMACSRLVPHMSSCGVRLRQTAGRSGAERAGSGLRHRAARSARRRASPRHAGDGRADRRRDAAGRAAGRQVKEESALDDAIPALSRPVPGSMADHPGPFAQEALAPLAAVTVALRFAWRAAAAAAGWRRRW